MFPHHKHSCFLILQEYSKALGYTKILLQVEPGNRQVQTLKNAIEKRMERGVKTLLYVGFHIFNP